MTATVLRGNALALPLSNQSVDLVVTSPPYFGLRSYQDDGQHYGGQIGSEASPTEFIDSLIAATAEMVRVLKPSGSIWVNLGDKYSGAQAQNIGGKNRAGDSARTWRQTDPKRTGIPNKSLMGNPWRYAIRCIDELHLVLRSEVIWSKPNGLPESVTDRVRRSHEQWFHFTVQGQYFSAVDEIREEHNPVSVARSQRNRFAPDLSQVGVGSPNTSDPSQSVNPLGKLPGSVWSIPTQPLAVPPSLGVEHFAAFPMEWPRRIIRGWSPSGICTACGEGRRPVADRQPMVWRESPTAAARQAPGTNRKSASGTMLAAAETRIVGEACACPTADAPTRPAVVLDPFGGTGTTALMADVLGRHGVSVDMSADYCRLARWAHHRPRAACGRHAGRETARHSQRHGQPAGPA